VWTMLQWIRSRGSLEGTVSEGHDGLSGVLGVVV